MQKGKEKRTENTRFIRLTVNMQKKYNIPSRRNLSMVLEITIKIKVVASKDDNTRHSCLQTTPCFCSPKREEEDDAVDDYGKRKTNNFKQKTRNI